MSSTSKGKIIAIKRDTFVSDFNEFVFVDGTHSGQRQHASFGLAAKILSSRWDLVCFFIIAVRFRHSFVVDGTEVRLADYSKL
jgi:hypothetical protein